MSAEFGISAERREEWDADTDEIVRGWHVSLPHHCDGQDIAGSWSHPASHAEAVAGLERFIAEAQTVLAALREHRETPEPVARPAAPAVINAGEVPF